MPTKHTSKKRLQNPEDCSPIKCVNLVAQAAYLTRESYANHLRQHAVAGRPRMVDCDHLQQCLLPDWALSVLQVGQVGQQRLRQRV